MQFVKGMVVRSKNGHDKGSFYVVCGSEGCLLLSDGQAHPISRPKRKNPIHLAPTKTVLADESLLSDSEIRKALSRFSGRPDFSKEVM